MTHAEQLRNIAAKSCQTNSETEACLIAADALDEVAALRERVAELVEALLALIPMHRDSGHRCWCPVGFDGTIHTYACWAADAALKRLEGVGDVH